MKILTTIRTVLISSIFVIGITPHYSNAQATWTQISDFGGGTRYGAVGFSINTKGYVGTGNQIGSTGEKKDFWEYDPQTDIWTQKADFGGVGRIEAIALSIGNKGYIGMGTAAGFPNGFQDFWEYDPGTNVWSQKADFGGGTRVRAISFSISGKGYVGSGESTPNIFLKDFWEYNPQTDSWVQKTSIPGSARTYAVGFSIGSLGYVTTGYEGNSISLQDVWEYNPITDLWTQKVSFGGAARYDASAFSIGGKGYVCGGRDQSGIIFSDIWEFDPTANTWQKKPDIAGGGRSSAVAFSIGNLGYLGTGIILSGPSYDDFWKYAPDTINLPTYVPPNGLVGWWPFNGNADDESGNGNHGTTINATLTTDRKGSVDSAYEFDGVDDYISGASNSTLDVSASDKLTISAWVRPDTHPIQAASILTHSDNSASTQYSLRLSQSNGYFISGASGSPHFENNGGNYSSASVPTSAWTHLVMTYDGSSIRYYINGVLDTIKNEVDTFPTSFIGEIEFATSNPTGFNEAFDGKLDDLAVWNRALTDQEIQTLFVSCDEKPDFVSLGAKRTTDLCPNDSVKIFVVNPKGPGLSYQWFKSDVIIPGAVDSFYYATEVRKYKVRVSSGQDCFRMSGRIQPTIAIPPLVSITPQGSIDICAGDSVLLVANYVPGYNYQWRRYGVDIPGATDTILYASQPGNYKIFISNSYGCFSKSSLVSVNIVCRVAGDFSEPDIDVYPNPARDKFNIKFYDIGEEIPVLLEVRDSYGKLIGKSALQGKSKTTVITQNYIPGVYSVRVWFESGEHKEVLINIVE